MDNDYRALDDLVMTTKDGRTLLPAVSNFFRGFEARFQELFEGMRSDFLNLCKEQDKKIATLSDTVNKLKLQIGKLEEKIDDQEAYERRDTVVISGDSIPIGQVDENCMNITCKLVKDELNLVIATNDISTAHRLGPKPAPQSRDKRKIIVKFCRRDCKTAVISAARRIKSNRIYVNESLTPQRQSIAYALRKAKASCPDIVSGSTTLDGSVYVWVKPANPGAPGARDSRMKIDSYAKLEDFCTKTLGRPLSNFLTRRDL